jgi:uroporphyrinogen decarboxylase
VRAALGDACPPLVLYSQGTSPWAELLPRTGADAFSVDWRLPLGEWKRRLGGRPVQGNLDPTALHGTPESVRAATRRMLASAEGEPGVVANLGHGVIVGTPVDNVRAFVEEVQGKGS